MLGPLPPLYRYAVCAVAFLGCVGVGAWLGLAFDAPAGAGLGAALGVVVVALLLHDHTEPRAAHVRHRPRQH
jgi:hypothetical protein